MLAHPWTVFWGSTKAPLLAAEGLFLWALEAKTELEPSFSRSRTIWRRFYHGTDAAPAPSPPFLQIQPRPIEEEEKDEMEIPVLASPNGELFSPSDESGFLKMCTQAQRRFQGGGHEVES